MLLIHIIAGIAAIFTKMLHPKMWKAVPPTDTVHTLVLMFAPDIKRVILGGGFHYASEDQYGFISWAMQNIFCFYC